MWAGEPTGNLDTHMADQILELLHELNRSERQTIVLVTHDPGIGESANRLVRMVDGSLLSDEHRVADGQWEPHSQRSALLLAAGR